ncbi:hypothetical protein ANN_14003 [Periplaneta americana]|uniref:Uncharacterized protein n=1 Tax=Periplaneta americana TaxID=6978 RepID=A0ABQ8SW44_PERAM|nr:hypothetical protein ANN_14003 [Periplaneta americana]
MAGLWEGGNEPPGSLNANKYIALVEHAGNQQTTSLLRRNLPNKYDATTVCLGEEKMQILEMKIARTPDRAQLQTVAELVTELLDIVQPYNEEGGTDIRKDPDLISNEIENSPHRHVE